MSKFIPTSRRNGACEVCGDESGKCRRHEDLHLCMTFSDSKKGDVQNGYKCLKPDTGKGWATFKLDDSQEWSDQQRREWQAKAQLRRQQRQTEAEDRKKRSIAEEERDRLYRQLLCELTLHPDDRVDLHRRGFSNLEIELIGYKSVSNYQQIQHQYPELLPGIAPGGQRIISLGIGYLCPIKNKSGRIVSCQLRLRVIPEGQKNRYRWFSQEEKGHVPHFFPAGGNPEGELPLAICRPQGHPRFVALAEGTGAKPNFVALHWEAFTIGAAGGQWAGSPATLREAIEVGIAESGDRCIRLYPDAGDIQNRHVASRWENLINLLQEWGYPVSVGWWNQRTKDDSDIDELSPEQFAQIHYLGTKDFLAILAEQFPERSNLKSSVVATPHTGQAWDLWRKSRWFRPDHQSNTQYFDAPIPGSDTATYIRSGTGTGKTHWLRQVIKLLANQGFLSIGYRNSLLIQFAENDQLAGTWHHLQQDLKDSPTNLLLIRDPLSKILCCVDSLSYFEPQDFDSKIVILDEVESIIEQFLKGNTAVSQQRERIKYLFIEMLKRCDRIIFLDGHLRDSTVEYLQNLMENCKQPVRYLNTYTGNKGQVEFLEGVEALKKIKANDRSPVIEAIKNNPNQFVVGADSQEELEALERILKAQGRTTLRFDSTTGHSSWAQQFLKDPPKYLQDNDIEILLYSPSAEAGLNIDIKGYFSDAYFLFFGVITTNAQLQLMARVRDPEMDIHIWCSLLGLPAQSVSKSAIPEKLTEEIKQYVLDCAMASLSGLSVEEVALKLAHQLIELSADAHFTHEMLLTALENHERAHLRDCLREGLQQSGYRVKSVIGQSADLVQLSSQRQEIRQERADAIYRAADITTEEANQKVRSFSATAAEKDQVAKRRLLDRLPGIERATYLVSVSQIQPVAAQTYAVELVEKPVFDSEFIHQVKWKQRGLISQIELRWLLEHPEAAKQLQQIRWYKRLLLFTDPDEPDSMKRMNLSDYHSRWLKTNRLSEIGIKFFLQPGVRWSADTPEAIAFWQAAKHPRTAKAIGRRVGKSSVCTFVGEVLKSIGYETVSEWNSQKKQWVYRVLPQREQDPIRTAIYEAVGRRFEAVLGSEHGVIDWQEVTCSSNSPQSQIEQAIETRSPALDFVLTTPVGDQVKGTSQPVLMNVSQDPSVSTDAAELAANALLLSEATEFGIEAVMAIIQPWSATIRRLVVKLLRSQYSAIYERCKHLLGQSEARAQFGFD